jgi:hypothetical protein
MGSGQIRQEQKQAFPGGKRIVCVGREKFSLDNQAACIAIMQVCDEYNNKMR